MGWVANSWIFFYIKHIYLTEPCNLYICFIKISSKKVVSTGVSGITLLFIVENCFSSKTVEQKSHIHTLRRWVKLMFTLYDDLTNFPKIFFVKLLSSVYMSLTHLFKVWTCRTVNISFTHLFEVSLCCYLTSLFFIYAYLQFSTMWIL